MYTTIVPSNMFSMALHHPIGVQALHHPIGTHTGNALTNVINQVCLRTPIASSSTTCLDVCIGVQPLQHQIGMKTLHHLTLVIERSGFRCLKTPTS